LLKAYRARRQIERLTAPRHKILSRFLKNTAICGALAVSVVLAAGAAAALAPPTQSVIFEGPGGRIPLTRWALRSDPANRGLALGWRSGHFGGTTVSLPNVVHPAPYSGRAGGRNYEGSVAWYETTFQAARPGAYALSFQSANFRATVWVDGHELGSHRGSYLPFEVRPTLAAGRHTVVVRVDWRDPAEQSREGFHRTWFNWGGLDGEVDVRPVGESELSNPTITTTLSPDTPGSPQAAVTVSVEVHNNSSQRTIVPEGSLVHGGQTIPLSFPAQNLAKGQTATATSTVTIAEPALWSPRAPNLYALSLAVGSESSFSARVGLRQLTWSQGRVYLNGQRLLLHGASIQEDARGHGDALTPADEDGLVGELRAIGANAVRSQHPLDPALLERLDAAGFLVWQGIGPVEGAGNWYSSTPRLNAEAEQQARTAALAAELHPSIVVWNLVNEVAGNGRDSAEVAYVQSLTRWLHARDPGRMVAVDVWGDHPPVHAGSLYSGVDAVAETDYTGWYDHPRDTLAQQAAMMRSRLAAMHRTFPGKVLVISEFGAESNTLNPPGSPGSYGFQSRLLANHIAVYERDPYLSGMLVWDLRDYPLEPTFAGGSIHGLLPKLRLIEGINQKGLFTYGDAPKPAAGVVARLFKALPAE
jgi:Glycosyl hydrolases family 2, TIM barrel domain/Glycosyl hydrolases family 2/Glycosyl hydrolases family 2, sugar binding domain